MLASVAKRPASPPSTYITELTPQQRRAIPLLIAGQSVSDTASTIGVDRRTLQRWRNNNPHFQAEYNRQRTELYDTAQLRLHGMVHKAIDVLGKALEDGNLKAAIELLRIISHIAKPSTETDPEQLVRRQAEKMAVEAYTAEPFANVGPGSESVTALGRDIAKILRERYQVESALEGLVDHGDHNIAIMHKNRLPTNRRKP